MDPVAISVWSNQLKVSTGNILSEAIAIAKLNLYLKFTATHISMHAVFCGEKLDELLKQQKSTFKTIHEPLY